jgi:hypothetical protein
MVGEKLGISKVLSLTCKKASTNGYVVTSKHLEEKQTNKKTTMNKQRCM